MSHAFTERTATVFQRFMQAQKPYAEGRMKTVNEGEDEEAKERLEEQTIPLKHGGWGVELFYYRVYGEDEESEEEARDVMASIRVFRSNTTPEWALATVDLHDYTPTFFDDLVKDHAYCKECGRWELVEGSTFCRDCFPFVMERTDDCCVCLDHSEGKWVKLPCDHILHERCWKNVKSDCTCPHQAPKRCPLCRKEASWREVEVC